MFHQFNIVINSLFILFRNVIGTQGPVAWKKLFNIIKQNCHSKKLKESLLKMFHSHNMQLPKNFDLLLAHGFPCTCDKGHQKESFSSQKVIINHFCSIFIFNIFSIFEMAFVWLWDFVTASMYPLHSSILLLSLKSY